MNRVIPLLAILLLSSSCGDQGSIVVSDGYDGEFRLKDDAAQSLFIENLKTSGFDYKIGENRAVRYRTKDREKIQQLAFDSAEELHSDEQETNPEWKISNEEAKQIVLAKYPDILNSARMVGPMIAKVTTEIDSFAKPGEELWHIRIICINGGTKGLFFIHPLSGGVYDIQSSNGDDSKRCE